MIIQSNPKKTLGFYRGIGVGTHALFTRLCCGGYWSTGVVNFIDHGHWTK
jgi:hypothetical protein